MNIRSIAWKNNKIRIIDQTKLPGELVYLDIDNLKDLREAIKTLRVRGAPAIGAAGALGVYLGLHRSKARGYEDFRKELDDITGYLGSSRPTARNLFFCLERMRNAVIVNRHQTIPRLKKILFRESCALIEEDRAACRAIGESGARLLDDGDGILTICNAGILATIDYGTALGVIYRAHEQGTRLKVYACETRPLLQGARLTAWELKRKGIDVTLLCDNMAAALMSAGRITKTIVGADRIALNGDTANKIGTSMTAILSRYYKLPFYVAAPASTFDLTIKSGREIPIEQRSPDEVTALHYKRRMVLPGVKVFNPAFDVTDHRLITAIITDKGIIRAPYCRNIKKTLITKNEKRKAKNPTF